MLIPYNTDAPIYHWPYATVGLIVANTLTLLASFTLNETWFAFFTLQYNTINPLQWITSNFLHAGFIHLLSNMFALWGFGMVVEGKLGPARFVAIYCGLGVVQCCLVQFLGFFLIGEGGSLGASSIIYGLIAMALVWAPKNHMNCFLLLGYGMVFEAPILMLAVLLFMLDFATGVFSMMAVSSFGVAFTSEFLHLMGAALGFGLAVVLLKTNQVECEGWDLLSVMKGDHLLVKEQKASAQFETKLQNHTTDTLSAIRNYLQSNQPGLAKAAHLEAKQFVPGWQLPEPEMAALIEGLVQRYQWNDAVDIMVEYLRTHQERATTVRVMLGRVCLERLNRPLQALKVLAKLDLAQLPPVARAEVEKIKAVAIPRAEADPFEVIHPEW
jgi:membrane associated rhomboid family serine protease